MLDDTPGLLYPPDDHKMSRSLEDHRLIEELGKALKTLGPWYQWHCYRRKETMLKHSMMCALQNVWLKTKINIGFAFTTTYTLQKM